MSSTENKSDQHNWALELSSASIDGELNVGELQEFSDFLATNGPLIENFSHESQRIGDLLRAIPFQPLKICIFEQLTAGSQHDFLITPSSIPALPGRTAPRAAAADSEKHFPSKVVKPAWSVRLATGIAFSVLGLLLTLTLGPQQHELRLNQVSTAIPDVHAQGEDWQILVLKVASRNRAAIRQQIRQIADQGGLTMHGTDTELVSETTPLGIVLTSLPGKANDFIESVTQSGIVESEEWNPPEIGDMDRETLIAAVRHSMQHPTQSELYFGEVFFALPIRQEKQEETVTQLLVVFQFEAGRDPHPH